VSPGYFGYPLNFDKSTPGRLGSARVTSVFGRLYAAVDLTGAEKTFTHQVVAILANVLIFQEKMAYAQARLEAGCQHPAWEPLESCTCSGRLTSAVETTAPSAPGRTSQVTSKFQAPD